MMMRKGRNMKAGQNGQREETEPVFYRVTITELSVIQGKSIL
jgi:hypothetical protein